MRILRSICFLLLALVLASGCGDSPTLGPTEGELVFTYSGAHSGTYRAVGALVAGQGVTGQFAAAKQGSGYIVISSFRETAPPMGDRVVISLEGPQQVGSFPAGDVCTGSARANCANGGFAFDFVPGGDGNPVFPLTGGSFEVTSVSGGRIRGRFSGVAERNGETVTITSGRFDLPFLLATQDGES